MFTEQQQGITTQATWSTIHAGRRRQQRQSLPGEDDQVVAVAVQRAGLLQRQ
jgi:hypothetical protein